MAVQFGRRRHTARAQFRFVDQFAVLEGLRGPNPEPIGELEVHVVAYQSGNERRAIQPIRLELHRNSLGDHVWFGRGVPPSTQGRRPRSQTPRTITLRNLEYELQVVSTASIYGVETILRTGPDLVALPGAPSTVQLSPGIRYPFAGLEPVVDRGAVPERGAGPTVLRGTLRDADGSGMGGVRVQTQIDMVNPVDPFQPPEPRRFHGGPTDHRGQWLIAFTGRGSQQWPLGLGVTVPIDLQFESDGQVLAFVSNVLIIPGKQTSHSQTTLTGRILDARQLGLDDVNISIDIDPTLKSRSAADGTWSLCFPVDRYPSVAAPQRLDLTVTATLSSGESRSLRTQFQPGRTTTVGDIQFAPSS